MTDRVLRANALTDNREQFLTDAPTFPGRLVLSNDLLAELRKQGLNYLHVIDRGEGAVGLAASRNRTIGSNDRPSADPTSEQVRQGFVDLSGFQRSVGIRLGENGSVYKLDDLARRGQEIPGTGTFEQHGLDITNPPAPSVQHQQRRNGPRP